MLKTREVTVKDLVYNIKKGQTMESGKQMLARLKEVPLPQDLVYTGTSKEEAELYEASSIASEMAYFAK